MNKKILISLMFSALVLNVAADTPTFNFLKVGYTAQKHDIVGDNFDGFELAGNYEISDDFYLSGKYVMTSDRGLDLAIGAVGLGYQMQVTDGSIFFTQLDAANVVFERDNAGKFEEIGFQLGVGFRANLSEDFELETALKYLNAGEVDATFGDYDLTLFSLGVNYLLSDTLGFYADFETESDSNRYSIGMKYEF